MNRFSTFAAIASAVLVPIALLMSADGNPDERAAAKNAGNRRLMTSRAGSCASILRDGRILITGGEVNKVIVATVESFSVISGTSEVAAMSTPRAEHACAVLMDGRVLVAGGSTIDGATLNTIEVFDPVSGAWSTAGILTTPRAGATASLLSNGKVLIAGGETPSGVLSSIEIYDPGTKTSEFAPQAMASNRSQHAAAVLANGKVLIVGGSDGTKALDTMELFDPATGTLSSAGKLGHGRWGLAATILLDGRIYLSGGSDGKREFNTAEIYNASTGGFTAASLLGAPRTNHLALRLPQNNAVLIVGGKGNGQMMAGAELYIPWWDKYRPLASVKLAQADRAETDIAALIRQALSEKVVSAATSDPSLFPVLSTDKDDYSPGQTAHITGVGWPIGATVSLHLDRDPNHANLAPKDWTVTVDAVKADGSQNTDGSFATTYDVVEGDLGEAFTLTAYVNGTLETAQIKRTVYFTDSQPQSITVGAQNPNPVNPGSVATYQVSVAVGGNNTACTITLTAPVNPATGATASWGAGSIVAGSEIRLSVSTTGADVQRTLTVTTTNPQTAPGTYQLPIIAIREGNCQGNGNLTANPVPTLVVASACSAASITSNPASQNIIYGANATFTAAATGSPAPTIEWQVSTDGSTWSVVPGETSTSLTIVKPPITSSGNRYRAVFKNSCDGAKTTISSAATLTITPKSVTGSITASNKVYDGNTTAAIASRSIATGSILAGDDVSLTGGTATFDTATAGTGKTVTVTGLTLTGTSAANYALASTTLTTTADITAKQVSGSFTASDKGYDGSTAATIATRSIANGIVGSDDVGLAGGNATFDNKNIGTDKTVTGVGFTLSGSSAENYTLASTTLTTTADITAKPIAGQFTAENKVYDGTTTANIASRSLTGVISGDITTLTGGAANFADKNAGTGKTVTATGFTLSGADGGNYSLSSVALTTTADITAKPITAVIAAEDKVYDATDGATIASRSLTGVIGSDAVSLNVGSSKFADKNVGTGKTVTAVGLSLTGADAVNYMLSSPSATATANITAFGITGSFTAANKIYDGTTSAIITGRSLSGVLNGDTVTLTGGSATFENKNVGAGKVVTGSNFTLTGADAGNYTITVATTTSDITPLAITGSVTIADKVYDATTTAKISGRSLAGTIANDGVSLAGGAASFADKHVGSGKTVSVTGLSLSGNDATNYTVNAATTATASITPALLTPSITVNSKAYDGGVAATIATRSVSTVLGTDNVSLVGGTATFADKNVGVGKTVSATGLNLSGTDAGNYTLSSTTVTATAAITALGINGTFTAGNKVYDGTSSATITGRSLSGVLNGDAVTLTGGSATFANKNVGAGKLVTGIDFTLVGTDAGNYTVTVATTTANITPLAITGSVTIADKVYDGTVAATITGRTLAGNISGDVTSLSGGIATFADKNAGANKQVFITGLALTGPDAGNYTVNSVATATATITRATPIISVVGGAFDYDGQPHAATANITGVPGDTLTGLMISYAPGNPILPGSYIATAAYAQTTNYNAASAAAMITISNPGPMDLKITGPTANANVFSVGTPVTLTATFSDTPGDTHTAVWNFDTQTLQSPSPALTIVEGANGSRTITGKFTFTLPGVYKMKLSVTDCLPCAPEDRKSVTTDSIDGLIAIIVIYDPSAGFVTGGGWLISNPGAYTADVNMTGKANFGFVSKYQKGATKPAGETEFQFKAGNLNFTSTSYDWLVISGAMAQYKGVGMINGQPGYSFILTARDGGQPGGGGLDGFRIKIIQTSTGATVYDNVSSAGSDDLTSANVQVLGGGSIQIHQSK